VENRSPNYYVKKRLLQNKPAVFGLAYIVATIIVAILGYLIMPDQTPNANDGAVQIQKKPPGFEVSILKMRKNLEVLKPSFFGKMMFGAESEYTIVPIKSYSIEGEKIIAEIYGREAYYKELDLIDAIFHLYTGHIDKAFPSNKKYEATGEGLVRYFDQNGDIKEISREALIDKFKKENIEKRYFVLGTDKAGRDILSRLLFGTRISLSIGFLSVLLSIFLGVSLGAMSGFYGGRVDAFIMWLMSVIWSIPGIMLVIAISMALQSRGVWVAFVAVGLTMWVDVARVIRGQMMAIKEKQFVEAARAFGFTNFRIVMFHIMPNILGPLIVIATANFAAAILLEAGLSFLGLSVQPPTPSWGIMIFEGYQAIGTRNSWHLVVFPGLAICMMVLAFNLLGNGLRDAFDPKTLLK